MLKYLFYGLMSFLILNFSCTTTDSKQINSKVSIQFIDKIVVENDKMIDSTYIGGFSSIDFLGDSRYIIISDDRSEYSSARMYEVEIDFDTSGINQYEFKETIFLKNKEGEVFEENELDPESIRYRPSSNSFVYTSEGGRTKSWIDPFIWEINRNGEFLSEVNVPDIFNFNDNKGLRVNGGFESVSFENDTIIWYANELPLKEDGEVPGFEEGKYPVRLVRHDIKNDVVLNQYAYNISPLNQKPDPEDAFYINSVPEILFIEQNKLWIMERSYTTGVGNFIKIFEIEIINATDIKHIGSLANQKYSPVSKKQIIDFSDYSQKIDNIEGMTFGPDFPDGRKSLLFVSDDNFNEGQETQFWLFSVNGL
ncbi:esterase-like activity of phytase family protein [Marivirga tractuosa]|uniref:esterase-like activity of phytase family protein n=1 Tax=Marivirga tractuosa TaxID=1006 RepID=UPI0035CFD04A